MKHLDPSTDFEVRESEAEYLEEHSTYSLKLDDFLSSYMEINGVNYDTHATAWFTKTGINGAIEVYDLEIKNGFSIIDDAGNRIEGLALPKSLQEALYKLLEAQAIAQASLVPNYQWERDEA